METVRIIPCLDVDAGRVVKGVNFVGLRDAGDPVEMAARYDHEGADELVFLDITASADERETTLDMVRRVAEEVFIPFTVGGGIRSVEAARQAVSTWVHGVRLGPYGVTAKPASVPSMNFTPASRALGRLSRAQSSSR